MGNGGWKQGVAWAVAGIRIIIPCVLEIVEHFPTHCFIESLQIIANYCEGMYVQPRLTNAKIDVLKGKVVARVHTHKKILVAIKR